MISTIKLNPDEIRSLYWAKKYTVAEIANKLDISFWQLYNFMHKYNISCRKHSEANYVANKTKPKFNLKTHLSIADEKLKIAGIMLYWAEGTFVGNTVDFTNSNPEMVKIYIKFLREVCGVKEERLRVYLYAYPHHNIEELKAYWQSITKIPLSRFTQPYIRKGNKNLSGRKLLHGLVHIRYNDKQLIGVIKNWIDEYNVLWAGS
ncbi:MAG: hypothetical protein WCI77_10750 [Candidatus Omnitrophota bacterium]